MNCLKVIFVLLFLNIAVGKMKEEPKKPKNIKMIEVSRLEFDPQNPRLPAKYREGGEESALEYLVIHGRILDLINSIGDEGYFPGEPLLVVKSKQNIDKYTVIEGNRRLAALKLLSNPKLAKTRRLVVNDAVDAADEKPKEVPCVEFDKREDVLSYLGYRHITGSQQWSPLSKSQYLYQLYNREKANNPDSKDKNIYKEIARFIGSKSDYVSKLLRAYKVYLYMDEKNFWDISNLNEESIEYSILYTALGYPAINDFLFKNPTNENFESLECDSKNTELFARSTLVKDEATGQSRLGESRNLKHLNSIVKNPSASRAFFEKGLSIDDAVLYTEEPLESAREFLLKSDHYLNTANEKVYNIRCINTERKEQFTDLLKELIAKCNKTIKTIEVTEEC